MFSIGLIPLININYCWPLNTISLNCMSPLIHGFFSIVNTTVLQDPRLVSSVNAEPRMRMADYKLYMDFQACRGWAPLTPMLFKGQLYFIHFSKPINLLLVVSSFDYWEHKLHSMKKRSFDLTNQIWVISSNYTMKSLCVHRHVTRLLLLQLWNKALSSKTTR